jgi:replication-associated recombination protein RarA
MSHGGDEALTKNDIVEAVREALADHPCRYELSPQQVDHVVGMLADIGDGDLRRGVEIVRVNHKWVMDRAADAKDAEYSANHELVSAIRRGMGSVGMHLAKGVAWAVVTALAVLVWIGFKSKIFQ